MGKHWLDGLWHFEDFKFMLHEVKGEVCYWKNLGAFDYPDLGIDSVQGTWEYGKFGETSAEVKKATVLTPTMWKSNCMEGKLLNEEYFRKMARQFMDQEFWVEMRKVNGLTKMD